MNRILFRLLVFLAALAFVGAATWMVYDRILGLNASDLGDLDSAARRAYINTHPPEPAGSNNAPVQFIINPGETGQQVADRLYQQGLINDVRLFRYYVIEERLNIEAGTYTLNETMTPIQVADVFQHGRAGEAAFTVPEGRRLEEIAELATAIGIDRASFVSIAASNAGDLATSGEIPEGLLGRIPVTATLEGYLFPDTYLLPQGATAVDLVVRMLTAFDARVTAAMDNRAASLGRDLHDVVIVASIVEREAVLAEERSVIASVYLNRLKAGIKLDADPTVQYAIGQSGEWWPIISTAHYASVDSPWNTYLYTGLPPGPIANPGLESIKAVLEPAETPYLFFMRDCDADDGSHMFASSEAEHLTNYAHCFGE